MAIPRPDTRRQPPKLPPQMRPFDDLDGLAASRMPAKPNTDRRVGATQPPAAIESRSDKKEAERRRAYEESQAAQAEAAGQDYDKLGNPSDANDANDKRVEAEYARRAKDPGGDGMDELARARQAAAQEIDAQNARAAMDQRSRAGLGGLGLSGAASASEGDLARTQARSKVLTMQQFDQAAEDAKFTDVQRRAALDDLEDAADTDYNDDGKVAGEPVGGTIGDGDLENDPIVDNSEAEDRAGTPTDMPVGATDKQTEKYIKALPERGRGVSLFGEPDPLVSGPHKMLGSSFYVYRRQDNSQLYKSKENPAAAMAVRSTPT